MPFEVGQDILMKTKTGGAWHSASMQISLNIRAKK